MTYPITTICGTMRLFDNMLTVADELTRQGSIVLMPFTRKSNNSPLVRRKIAAPRCKFTPAGGRDGALPIDSSPPRNFK